MEVVLKDFELVYCSTMLVTRSIVSRCGGAPGHDTHSAGICTHIVFNAHVLGILVRNPCLTTANSAIKNPIS